MKKQQLLKMRGTAPQWQVIQLAVEIHPWRLWTVTAFVAGSSPMEGNVLLLHLNQDCGGSELRVFPSHGSGPAWYLSILPRLRNGVSVKFSGSGSRPPCCWGQGIGVSFSGPTEHRLRETMAMDPLTASLKPHHVIMLCRNMNSYKSNPFWINLDLEI